MLANGVVRVSDLPPPLQSGDVLVFVKRNPLHAAVITLRSGQPVFRETPVGPREAYSLGVRYEQGACKKHAEKRAAEHGLRISRTHEGKGKLYVRVV